VRKLAQLYGGDASVQSVKGEGSTFTVTLNDAIPAPAAARSSPGLAEYRKDSQARRPRPVALTGPPAFVHFGAGKPDRGAGP